MTIFSLNWNLNSLFSDSNPSTYLRSALKNLERELKRSKRKFKHLSDVKKGILHFQNLQGKCQDLQSFIECLLSQDVEDQQAIQFYSQMIELRAICESLGEEFNTLLAEFDEQTFLGLLEDSDIHPIAFQLSERRRQVKERLSLEQEQVIHRLSIDGYHGWSEVYQTFKGQLRIVSPIKSEGSLSIGQAENQLFHPDRNIRAAWFQRWEETWTDHEQLIAQILNHLAGFRLNLYAARQWPFVLQEPLVYNRMEKQTLLTMWETVEKHKGNLQDYLACKAQLIGVEKLAWHDLDAPLSFNFETSISFEEAARFIIQHFSHFSSRMGAFAQLAFDQCWIEAEDRSGKRPGGFCTPFLHAKQSRIFMTYSGTMQNVFTLAHELGHAYHSYEMRDLPLFAQQYRMNLAETASTLAEMVVIDSMIKQSQNKRAQLALLDYKLQRAVLFLMNIQARFLFEVDFYEQHRKGFILAKDLNDLMESAQKRAFGDILTDWHPHLWASKQHFYLTEVPFYNFPYTFGYLFSQGIYAHLQGKNGAGEAYALLLRDSSNFQTEDLAYRHLHVHLKEPFFWEQALKLIQDDVSDYLRLAASIS